ncbi:MAG: hypothetical protein F6K65_17275 [Moorea sp. SIO3C2]|nr:hypothetical protein [Moorena sp. SIO3C2]
MPSLQASDSLFPVPCSLRWCVTGRTIATLATKRKMRASPPLTHPTHSLFPVPDSRFPIPDSLY